MSRWWSQTGSNRRPPACKAGALPAELWPRSAERVPVRVRDHRPAFAKASAGHFFVRAASEKVVGLGRLELPTSRLSSARSNQLSYKPSAERTTRCAGSSEKKEKRRRRVPHDTA